MLLFCFLTAASAKAEINEELFFYFEDNLYKLIDRNGRYSASFEGPNDNFKGSNIDIPASVTYEGKSYLVTAIGENSFLSESLTGIYISQNVDSIAPRAFDSCPSLSTFRVDASNPFFIVDSGVLLNKEKTTLVAFPPGMNVGGTFSIPTSVTSIAGFAFYQSKLTSINISNVTNIDEDAFNGFSSLKEIDVSPSNPSFSAEDGVLFDKNGETLIAYPQGKTGGYDVPYNVTSISEGAFADCEGLTHINIDGIRYIGDGAFAGCRSLKSVELPSSLTSIGNGTFAYCGLTSVSIPDKVTSIGQFAFAGCPLEKISLGASLKTIAERAFMYVYRDKVSLHNPIPPTCGEGNFDRDITSDTILVHDMLIVPVGSEEAYENAYPWKKFKNIVGIDFNVNNEVTAGGIKYDLRINDFGERYCSIIGYDDEYGKLGDLTIPDKIEYEGHSYPVTRIEDYAFRECAGLTSVVIPNTVTYVGSDVFYWCKKLKSATFPNTITSLSDGTFSECYSLSNFTIPNSVKEIGADAFSGCRSLKNITIPSSVERIEDNAFRYCERLTSVVIPNTVTYVGEMAFWGCKNLKSAIFPNTITSLNNGTFWNCNSLSNFTIPNSVKEIGEDAFSGCTSLKNITIPPSVEKIERAAFMDCKGLTSVVIPNTVTYVGPGVFSGCENLKSAIFPNTITSLDGTFKDCTSLSNFTIPNSVKDIGISTFRGCTSLKNITIPASVEQFGYWWFGECNNLEELTCLNTTPPIAGNYGSYSGELYYFSDVTYTKATLYVPKESVEAYKTAEIWSNFKNIVGRDFSGISAEQTAGFSVSTDGGKLKIIGAKDKTVSVYTIGGAKVYGNNHYTDEDISVERGMYIVKVGAKSLVVTVK